VLWFKINLCNAEFSLKEFVNKSKTSQKSAEPGLKLKLWFSTIYIKIGIAGINVSEKEHANLFSEYISWPSLDHPSSLKMKLLIAICIVLAAFCTSTGASFSDCPPEGIAQVPHSNCSLFIVCVHGAGSIIQCPKSLYYNPQLEYCDYAENVQECVEGTRAPGIGSTTETTQEPTQAPTTSRTTQAPPPNVCKSSHFTLKLNIFFANLNFHFYSF